MKLNLPEWLNHKAAIKYAGLSLAGIVIMLLVVLCRANLLKFFDSNKESFEGVQAFLTSVAIVVGGVWTYNLYSQNRQKYPRAELTHKVEARNIGDKILLHISLNVKNIGNVVIRVTDAHTRVRQVLPLAPSFSESLAQGADLVIDGQSEVFWDIIGKRELVSADDSPIIEPSESHDLRCDFVIGSDVRTIQIDSYVGNVAMGRRSEIGWNLTTNHDTDTSPNPN